MDNEATPKAATLFNVEPLKEFNSTDPQRARRCLRAW